MLCPEVCNFPPPKVVSSYRKSQNLEDIEKTVKLNNFYKSVIITCPDELNTPKEIEEVIIDDSDYYKISNCSLVEFLEPIFIKSFVKNGKLYCLTSDRKCIVQNCACITPDGILTLHLLEFVFQTLGLEGKKAQQGFMEIKIDLIHGNINNKIRNAVEKLEKFDFYVNWEPETEEICPSSIAKYFADKNITVTSHNLVIQRLTPDIKQIPTLVDTEIDELVEWIGMLAHNADIAPTEGYVSSYSEPECSAPINTNRISLLIVKGFLTPTLLTKLLQIMSEYVKSREIENYWASISIQSVEESLWRWDVSSPCFFQSHNSSCNIFFSEEENIMYSIGQLKYS